MLIVLSIEKPDRVSRAIEEEQTRGPAVREIRKGNEKRSARYIEGNIWETIST